MGTECIYWPCQGHVVSHLVVGRLVSGKGDVEVSLLCGGERGDAKVPWLYLPHQAASYCPSEPELSGSPVCCPQKMLHLFPPVPGLARASQGVSVYCLVTGTSFLGVRLTLPPPE